MKTLIVALGSVLLVGILLAVAFVSLNNKDRTLRNAIKAKESSREAVFDETWKTIQQVAQVSDKYSKDFKEIYPKLMEGRYGKENGNLLLKFVTESNPNFDTSLYSKLINVIEVQRAQFTTSQKQIIDLKREHDNLLDTFPGSLLITNREKVEIKIITSTRTKEVMETGKDDNVNLF